MSRNDRLVAPIFSWANWWLSDDIFTGIQNSFFSSKNVNIRDNNKWISINKALVKDSTTVVVEQITSYVKVNTTDRMAFGDAWGIYRYRSSAWVKITSDSPATKVMSACQFGGYIYWTTTSAIHRLLVTNISDDITATDVINRQVLDTAEYHPLLVSALGVYVWNKSSLWIINPLNIYSNNFTIESGSVIKELNGLWWVVRVLTISSLLNNNIYLRNWSSPYPDQTIPLIGHNVYHSVIFWWYNYLITNKWLAVVDWYNVIIIKETDQFVDNIGSVCIWNNKLYIWGIGWVYCFGAKNKNYPNVLNMEYSTSNGVATDKIWALASDWVILLSSWSNAAASTFAIDRLSSSTYYTTAEMVFMGYPWSWLHQIKEAIQQSVWYKPTITGQSIKTYYSIDWGAFVEIRDYVPWVITKSTWTDDMVLGGTFHYISFKVVLEWPWTSTPELYSLLLVFNNLNQLS